MNRKLNIWISEVFLILFFLPITNQIFASVSVYLEYGQYLGFIWSILVLIKLKIYSEEALLPIWIFVFTMLFSTLINGTKLLICINMVLPIVACCILTVHILRLRGFQGVEAIAKILAVLLVLQGASALVGGLGSFVDGNMITLTNYFFRERVTFNRIFIYAISLLTLAFIYGKKWEWLYVIGGISGVYFVLYESVSTAIMTFIVYVLVFVVARIIKSEHIWRNMLILLLAIAALFVIAGFSSDGFKWILIDFLGEDLTLDGRTLIWAQAIDNLHGWHWIFGNGYGHSYLFWLGSWRVGTAHSQYMNILFCHGLIGIGVYSYVIYRLLSVIREEKDEKFKRLTVATVSAIIVSGIPTTTYTSVYIYVLYTVFVLPKYYRQNLKTND